VYSSFLHNVCMLTIFCLKVMKSSRLMYCVISKQLYFSIAFAILFFVPQLGAQTPDDSRLLSALESFERGDWQAALRDLDMVGNEGLSVRDQAVRDVYRGVIALGLGDVETARARMSNALRLDPAVRLDPTLHAPSRIQFLQQLRLELIESQGEVRSLHWVDPPDVLFRGASYRLALEGRSAGGEGIAINGVRWAVSDSAVASIDATGTVIAISDGEATVEAIWGMFATSFPFLVRSPRATNLQLVPDSVLLEAGQALVLRPSVNWEDGEDREGEGIRFRTSNPDVVSVEAGGRVVALAPGQAEVFAQLEDAQAVAVITVREVAGVNLILDASQRELRVGESVVVRPTVIASSGSPLANRQIQLRSSDPRVAEFRGDNTLFALRPGFVEVTARSEEGLVAVLGLEVLSGSQEKPESPSLWGGLVIPFVIALFFRMF
jgi:hypothetical protein